MDGRSGFTGARRKRAGLAWWSLAGLAAAALVPEQQAAFQPLVVVECSRGLPRTGVAVLRWPRAWTPALDSVRLDVTVFRNGFAAGKYLLIPLAQGIQGFLPSDSTPVRDKHLRAYQLGVSAPSSSKDTVAVHVARLEGGINYFWRLERLTAKGWVAGGVVRAQAPTCGMDEPDSILP